MKHVTVDARWLETSGIGTYLQNVLPGIVRDNANIDFLFLGNIKNSQKYIGQFNNVNFASFESPMYSIEEQFKYRRLIPKSTDLYFSTHYNIPLLTNHKLLVTVYDLFHLAKPDLVRSHIKTAYARIMFHSIAKRASEIITISEFSKSEFLDIIGKPRCSIHAIPLGVEITPFGERGSSVAGMQLDEPFLLFVGNIKPHKNLKCLIDAFLQISDNIPHKLYLVGKKEGFLSGDESIGKLVASHADRIVLTGFVDDTTLNQLYRNADLFVFPSVYEGFGLPPLEAMARGCATLVSNAASMPEVCGNASVYFDPENTDDLAEKLYSLLTNEHLRNQLKRKGAMNVKKFDWGHTIEQTSRILRGALLK
ncbi:glycosyltransferase family 4 protein [Paracoccaceae bacterium]|nr:glycosyltransferase family 4 protein [Paracoccaceae bacterium]